MSETTRTELSLYGRLADELTRDVISARAFEAVLLATGQSSLRKDDGYFVFTDLEASATDYEISVRAPSYQARTLAVNLPTTSPVEVAYLGEDELFLIVTGLDAQTDRILFDQIPFVPTIRTDSQVIGPGSFTATLMEPLEGSDVDFAMLSSVSGLVSGDLLRIVRSTNLMLQPGPYYPFDDDTTLVVIKVVENTAGDPPISGSVIVIDQINTVALTTTAIGGVDLYTASLPGPTTLLLGPDRAVQTTTNERGDAVFYFASDTPITELHTQITRSGYVTATETIMVTPGQRTMTTVRLVRL